MSPLPQTGHCTETADSLTPSDGLSHNDIIIYFPTATNRPLQTAESLTPSGGLSHNDTTISPLPQTGHCRPLSHLHRMRVLHTTTPPFPHCHKPATALQTAESLTPSGGLSHNDITISPLPQTGHGRPLNHLHRLMVSHTTTSPFPHCHKPATADR